MPRKRTAEDERLDQLSIEVARCLGMECEFGPSGLRMRPAGGAGKRWSKCPDYARSWIDAHALIVRMIGDGWRVSVSKMEGVVVCTAVRGQVERRVAAETIAEAYTSIYLASDAR